MVLGWLTGAVTVFGRSVAPPWLASIFIVLLGVAFSWPFLVGGLLLFLWLQTMVGARIERQWRTMAATRRVFSLMLIWSGVCFAIVTVVI
jgi:hypothetical protein